jgi:UDP-3-O-[3-hydroxymyristoyl] N-acetylglucosamine deacetylase
MNQSTLASAVALSGIGTHTGKECEVILSPAPADSGISFEGRRITPASAEGNAGFTEIFGRLKTVEHIMASLSALGVDNADIASASPECPIFDGSALPIARRILEAGMIEQQSPRKYLKILRHVEYSDDSASVSLDPSDGFVLSVEIDYPPPIGSESFVFEMDSEAFVRDIAPARSFARQSDVDELQKRGFALGASLETGIGVGGGRVLNPGGLRFPDEFVRHKVADAIGDMATSGYRMIGRYSSFRGGHRQNNALLRKLFKDPGNFAVVS